MQIQTGTCQVTNGSNVVIANDQDWTEAIVGALFSVPAPDSSLIAVADVLEPGVSPSGFWELRLAAPYPGDTDPDASYQITKDFTPNLNLPLVNRGDVETGKLYNESMRILDENGGGVGGGADGEKTVTLQAHAITIAAGRTYRVTANFSATATFSLPTFRTRCECNVAGIAISAEETKRTTSTASWMVRVPDGLTVTTATLTAFLRGSGWASLTTTNVPASWTVAEVPDETTITLAPHTLNLDPGVNYRVTADFSAVSSFALPTFKTRCVGNLAGVVISPEEHKRTNGKASWLIFVQAGDYDYYGSPVELIVTPTITGRGWASATTANVAATWAVEEIGAEGTAGREIELRVNATHIQWRYVGEETWTDLIALSELQGPAGADGSDGDAVELRVSGTTLQWRYVGGAWADLFDLSTLGGSGIDPVPFGAVAATQTITNDGADNTIVCNITSGDPRGFDQSGGAWNPATGTFTASAAGVYEFSTTLELASAPAGETLSAVLYYNGAGYYRPGRVVCGTDGVIFSGTTIMNLAAGDAVTFKASSTLDGMGETTFYAIISGHRIK